MYTLESFFEHAKAELFRSNQDRRHPFRTMALANLGEFPGLRTIVKRKITSDLNVLAYTDSRSPKIKELKKNPNSSLLFYHPKKKLQVFFKTITEIIEDGDKYEQHKSTAIKYSKDYFTNQAPGSIISSPNYDMGELPHFTLLSFQPVEIQVLQLSQNQHYRAAYSKAENWKGKWLVP